MHYGRAAIRFLIIPGGLQVLLRHFCVDIINKEKKWLLDVVPLLFIDMLFQLWRNGG